MSLSNPSNRSAEGRSIAWVRIGTKGKCPRKSMGLLEVSTKGNGVNNKMHPPKMAGAFNDDGAYGDRLQDRLAYLARQLQIFREVTTRSLECADVSGHFSEDAPNLKGT